MVIVLVLFRPAIHIISATAAAIPRHTIDIMNVILPVFILHLYCFYCVLMVNFRSVLFYILFVYCPIIEVSFTHLTLSKMWIIF
jgi:hypothetical protein